MTYDMEGGYGRVPSIQEEFYDKNSNLSEIQRAELFMIGIGNNLTPLEKIAVWVVFHSENSGQDSFEEINEAVASLAKSTTKSTREAVSKLVKKGYLFWSNSDDGGKYLEVDRDLMLYGSTTAGKGGR